MIKIDPKENYDVNNKFTLNMKNLFKNYKALLTIAFLLFFKITFGQTDTEFWFAVPQFAHQHGAADATFNKNAY